MGYRIPAHLFSRIAALSDILQQSSLVQWRQALGWWAGILMRALQCTSVASPQPRPFQGLNQSTKLIPGLNPNALPSHALVGLFCTAGMGLGMVQLIGWVPD